MRTRPLSLLALAFVGAFALASPRLPACVAEEASARQARQRDLALVRKVFDDLRAPVRFTSAKLGAEALGRSTRLGRLEFMLQAADQEIELRAGELERLERQDAEPEPIAETRTRLDELRRQRDLLAARLDGLKADHVRQIAADGRATWSRPAHSADTLLRLLDGELQAEASDEDRQPAPQRTTTAKPASPRKAPPVVYPRLRCWNW